MRDGLWAPAGSNMPGSDGHHPACAVSVVSEKLPAGVACLSRAFVTTFHGATMDSRHGGRPSAWNPPEVRTGLCHLVCRGHLGVEGLLVECTPASPVPNALHDGTCAQCSTSMCGHSGKGGCRDWRLLSSCCTAGQAFHVRLSLDAHSSPMR